MRRQKFIPSERTREGCSQRSILTGLEKRVEDISETPNTRIRNNIAQIKGSIKEMRNMLDGMSSRMEEAEE